jgi:hypothetical protein
LGGFDDHLLLQCLQRSRGTKRRGRWRTAADHRRALSLPWLPRTVRALRLVNQGHHARARCRRIRPHITAPKSDPKRDFHAEKLRPDRNALGSAMLASCGQGRTDPGDQGQRNSRVVDQLRRAAAIQNEAQALRKQSRPSQGQIKLRIKFFRRNSSIGPPLDRDSRGRNRLEMTCPKSKP